MRWRRAFESVALGIVTPLQVLASRAHSGRVCRSAAPDGPILVVRCEASIGDNLLNVPFLRALRATFPGRAIHLLHHARARSVYEHCRYIDERIEIDWAMSSARTLLRRRRLSADALAGRSYALAFIPRWDEDLYAPFLAAASGAERIVGFSRRVRREKATRNLGIDLLLTDAVCDTSVAHESLRPLQLLDRIEPSPVVPSTALEFWFSANDAATVAALQSDLQVPSCRWVAIAPGAMLDRRKWPIERYAQVAKAIAAQPGVRLVFLGSAAERADGDALQRACAPVPTLNAAGRLSLAQSAAALATCRLFIGNDSGLLHLASAAGTPTIEVSCHPATASPMHPNAPARFGPTSVPSRVLQPSRPLAPRCRDGCNDHLAHCITAVDADAVLEAARALLDAKGSTAAEHPDSLPRALSQATTTTR